MWARWLDKPHLDLGRSTEFHGDAEGFQTGDRKPIKNPVIQIDASLRCWLGVAIFGDFEGPVETMGKEFSQNLDGETWMVSKFIKQL